MPLPLSIRARACDAFKRRLPTTVGKSRTTLDLALTLPLPLLRGSTVPPSQSGSSLELFTARICWSQASSRFRAFAAAAGEHMLAVTAANIVTISHADHCRYAPISCRSPPIPSPRPSAVPLTYTLYFRLCRSRFTY